jgi:hypothetical protein
MKGLIIDEPWIGMILSGDKTWEMRKTACHHRGPVALIRKGSGHIVATAEIIESLPTIVDASDYAKMESWHRIPPSRQARAFSDGWRTPWVLQNVRLLANPVKYAHPNGAVIWVNLDDGVSADIAVQNEQASMQPYAVTERPTNMMPPVRPHSMPRSDTSNEGTELHALVRRGAAAGAILSPHAHADGCYVVSPSRFKRDYIRVRSIEAVKDHLRRGYSLRMSNSARSPSLITPASVIGWR